MQAEGSFAALLADRAAAEAGASAYVNLQPARGGGSPFRAPLTLFELDLPVPPFLSSSLL